MKHQSSKKMEIFFWLALRQSERLSQFIETVENLENEATENYLTTLEQQLSEPEADEFARLKMDYHKKSVDEKNAWHEHVKNSIGSDGLIIDENIHRSHLEAALQREIPAIRNIVADSLSALTRTDNSNQFQNENAVSEKRRITDVEKSVCRAFAKQFVGLEDLSAATAFDYLSGIQLVRMIRLAGIREVALACVRIPAVESVAAFLRRFSPEDARVIAAQISSLPQSSPERLSSAESLVQEAMEMETNPAAMLDLIGLWIIGILLCADASERIVYTEQKLPLEVNPKLSEIIEMQCRKTSALLQRQISEEMEQLAETLAKMAFNT